MLLSRVISLTNKLHLRNLSQVDLLGAGTRPVLALCSSLKNSSLAYDGSFPNFMFQIIVRDGEEGPPHRKQHSTELALDHFMADEQLRF